MSQISSLMTHVAWLRFLGQKPPYPSSLLTLWSVPLEPLLNWGKKYQIFLGLVQNLQMALPVASSGCVGVNSSHSSLKALENPLLCIRRVSFGWDFHPPCVPLKGRYANFFGLFSGFSFWCNAQFLKCSFLHFLGIYCFPF